MIIYFTLVALQEYKGIHPLGILSKRKRTYQSPYIMITSLNSNKISFVDYFGEFEQPT